MTHHSMSPTSHRYTVASLTFALTAPDSICVPKLLPSYAPFASGDPTETPAFSIAVTTTGEHPSPEAGSRIINDTTNDLGHVTLWLTPGGHYLFHLFTAGTLHSMTADPQFSSPRISLTPGRDMSYALNSLVRIAFSQAILTRGGISIHASSVIDTNGCAYLFLGASGTGKSTHSRLWIENISGITLLNDDNPIIRLIGDRPTVFGSPWSGKTPCYRSISAHIGGIARIERATANAITPRTGPQAFITLLPSCSAIKASPLLFQSLCTTLSRLADTLPVATLHCLPDSGAALLCHKHFNTECRI